MMENKNNPVSSLLSEKANRRTEEIDTLDAISIVTLMNEEDAGVAPAVRDAIPVIADAIERIAEGFKRGGRLIYAGAGSSGRLGLLDALECPPTFGTPPEQVQTLFAGGMEAMVTPNEGAEDDEEAGFREAQQLGLHAADCLVGISASGRTPYCVGAMRYAKSVQACVISLTCNMSSRMGQMADVDIAVPVGPEVVAGSTRLKAGTAQKMVLNMLSTGSMIRTGHIYRNMMVDMRPSNSKLQQRAVQIVASAAGISAADAEAVLLQTNWQMKPAIVAILTGSNPEEAAGLLRRADGFAKEAIRLGQARPD